MAELKILRRCFAFATFIFALLTFVMLPVFLHAPFPRATSYFHLNPVGVILIFMRQLILMLPPVLAIVSGTAWWTLRKGSASARTWAMAASSLFLVYSLPFFVADIAIIEYSLAGAFAIIGVFASFFCFSGIGVAGLAYFSRFESFAPAPVVVRHF